MRVLNFMVKKRDFFLVFDYAEQECLDKKCFSVICVSLCASCNILLTPKNNWEIRGTLNTHLAMVQTYCFFKM